MQRGVRSLREGCMSCVGYVHDFRKQCSRFLAGTACACSLDGVVTKVTIVVAYECIYTFGLVHSVPNTFNLYCGCKKLEL